MDEMQLETLIQLLTVAQTVERFTKLRVLILDQKSREIPCRSHDACCRNGDDTSPFNEALSSKFGGYFRVWMEVDQAAAERWYASVMASVELIPQSIPKPDRESRMPDRAIMRNCFKALLDAGSEQAISMVGEMSVLEVAYAMSSDPAAAYLQDKGIGAE